jgi:hypothetical protein
MLLVTVKRLRHSQHLVKNLAIVLLATIALILYRVRIDRMERRLMPGFFDAARNPERVKIDWHDYKFMALEAKREGLGEHGVKAEIDGTSQRQRELYAANGYDGYLSDLISVNRSVPDVRPLG